MLRIFFTILSCFLATTIWAQDSTAGSALAARLADRMKDSLLLADQERTNIYAANMWLHEQKQLARSQYQAVDSIRVAVQRVENKRDSLYQLVLPPAKYELYIQRKTVLINNN